METGLTAGDTAADRCVRQVRFEPGSVVVRSDAPPAADDDHGDHGDSGDGPPTLEDARASAMARAAAAAPAAAPDPRASAAAAPFQHRRCGCAGSTLLPVRPKAGLPVRGHHGGGFDVPRRPVNVSTSSRTPCCPPTSPPRHLRRSEAGGQCPPTSPPRALYCVDRVDRVDRLIITML